MLLLGRLKVSNVDGNTDGIYDKLFTYGARSVSVFEVKNKNLKRIFDSGDLIETKIMESDKPDTFNANIGAAEDVVKDKKDSRSDDKVTTTAHAHMLVVILFSRY